MWIARLTYMGMLACAWFGWYDDSRWDYQAIMLTGVIMFTIIEAATYIGDRIRRK